MATWVTFVGYIASVLVGITFMMKTMIPLRRIAIVSNVFFITYAFFGGLYPVLILHSILLPLNIYRLYQMQKLVKDVKKASEGGYSFDWLVRYMTKEEFPKGTNLFKKGDEADKIYYISEGKIKIPDFNAILERGELLGEMGIFSPTKTRTCGAVTETEVIAYTISKGKMMELYHQNPSFGFYIVELLTRRYVDNLEKTKKSRVEEVCEPEKKKKK